MSRQFLRGLFLLCLCCYLAGPLFETFDFWDTPQEEMADIASSATGVLIWAAAGVCLAILLIRQLCRWCSRLDAARTGVLLLLICDLGSYFLPTEIVPL